PPDCLLRQVFLSGVYRRENVEHDSWTYCVRHKTRRLTLCQRASYVTDMSVTLKSVPRTSQARGSKSGRILVGERVADIALAMAKSKGIRLRDLVESAMRYYA